MSLTTLMAPFTTTYNPYSAASTTTPGTITSPQAPQNMLLDGVEIGVKSLIVGRMASKLAVQKLEITSIQDGQLSTKGLAAVTALKTGRNAALVSGAVSAGRNIYHLAKGEINVSRAGGNIGADILGGAVSGMVAGLGTGLTVGALAGKSAMAMGTAGLIVGTVGFAVLDTAYKFSGLRDTVSNKITEVIDRFFDRNPSPGGV